MSATARAIAAIPHAMTDNARRRGRRPSTHASGAPAHLVTRLALFAHSLLPWRLPPPAEAQSPDASDWGFYGGDTFGQRFSSLDQINRSNVTQLQVAWDYRTARAGRRVCTRRQTDLRGHAGARLRALFLETATNIVIALDPRDRRAALALRSAHRSRAPLRGSRRARREPCGKTPTPGKQGPCIRRVFTGTLDARLLALDAMTGQPCAGFGANGVVDLTQGMRIRDRGATR